MSFALVVVVVGFSALLGGKIIALAFNGGWNSEDHQFWW
jgi:hypothetical protein